MRSEDFVKKYHLTETYRFDRPSFIQDLMVIFDEHLASIPELDYRSFQDAVSDLRILWDNIFSSSKVSEEHSEKFWGFVYASEIIPRRNSKLPPPESSKPTERA